MHYSHLLILIILIAGCSSTKSQRRPLVLQDSHESEADVAVSHSADAVAPQLVKKSQSDTLQALLLVSAEQPELEEVQTTTPKVDQQLQTLPVPERLPLLEPQEKPRTVLDSLPKAFPELNQTDVALQDVIGSIYTSFPSVQAALQQRNIAYGNALEASGEFDFKIKGATENDPVGFYENYRQSIGFNQALLSGGEVFGGYRIGRGSFEPWYLERETNGGGELKAGFAFPLAQNRTIDPRREALWKANIGRLKAEPQIQMQLIEAVLAGSEQYWEWVAAGQRYDINASILEVTLKRTEGIELEVEVGTKDPPTLQENQRQILSREAKLISAEQKLVQSANKLSLFYRFDDGTPITPAIDQVPDFPEPQPIDEQQLRTDLQLALQTRPDLRVLEFERKQLNIELTQAINLRQPQLDAMVVGSQDMGEPTSSKQDKSRFELEAGIYLDVPLQRRKANGKITALQGKLSQLSAKRELLENKIAVDLQNTYAALKAAYESYLRADQSAKLAQQLVVVEQARLDVGQSDLFTLFLKEQVAVTAAEERVDALLGYYLAEASYRAVMAQDQSP